MSLIRSKKMSAIAIIFLIACPAFAQEEPKKEPEPSPNKLSMEINALQSLRQFNFSYTQMQQLQKLAEGAGEKDRERPAAKASKEYLDKMRELVAALVSADDDEKIDEVNQALDELREAENPTFDDGADITPVARQRAAEAFRMLRPSQLASVIGQKAEEIADPLDQLLDGMEKVRPLKGSAWREKRDEIADVVSRLVAGLDQDKADKVSDQVTSLLIRARGLSEADFKKQQPELEKAARNLIGNISPIVVLQHQIEADLATLLSNPRLPVVLRARLK